MPGASLVHPGDAGLLARGGDDKDGLVHGGVAVDERPAGCQRPWSAPAAGSNGTVGAGTESSTRAVRAARGCRNTVAPPGLMP